jgi:soluble lytic murein transglycosylase
VNEDPSEIQKQFESLTAFQNNEMPPEQQKEWIELCQTAPISASSPFCPLYLRETTKKAKALGISITPEVKKLKLRSSQTRALIEWKSNHWDVLTGQSEPEIELILRSIQSSRAALAVSDAILKKSQCLSSSLLLGIGIKLESAFPKEEFRRRAEDLYQMALNCGQDSASVIAGYRLGLFKIWRGLYEEAENVLSKVPNLPNSSDYRLRVNYWRYFCATKNRDEALKLNLREWMTREYPLSFHTLLVHPSKFGTDLQWKNSMDPEVSFRPKSNQNLAVITAAIEFALLKNDRASARFLLAAQQEKALNEAPAFRLYWATLLKRAGINSESFRLIAAAFRGDPSYIARSTLEALYPSPYIELIPQEEGGIARLLILSIIRQESAFDSQITSSAKAMGLMQLQLPTARTFEKRVTREQLFDPATNIRIGTKYIRNLVAKEKGAIELALASYNAGPGRVRQWKARYPINQNLLFIDLLPARETREYVSSILRNYFWYKNLYPLTTKSRSLASQLDSYIQSIVPDN